MRISFRKYKNNNLYIVKTSKGTFRWWPELSLVDFTPLRKRNFTDQISLRENTEIEALKAVIRLMDRN